MAMTKQQALEKLGFKTTEIFTEGQIKTAYKKLALKTHPDKTTYPADVNDAQKIQLYKAQEERFKAVNEAYQYLMSLEQEKPQQRRPAEPQNNAPRQSAPQNKPRSSSEPGQQAPKNTSMPQNSMPKYSQQHNMPRYSQRPQFNNTRYSQMPQYDMPRYSQWSQFNNASYSRMPQYDMPRYSQWSQFNNASYSRMPQYDMPRYSQWSQFYNTSYSQMPRYNMPRYSQWSQFYKTSYSQMPQHNVPRYNRSSPYDHVKHPYINPYHMSISVSSNFLNSSLGETTILHFNDLQDLAIKFKEFIKYMTHVTIDKNTKLPQNGVEVIFKILKDSSHITNIKVPKGFFSAQQLNDFQPKKSPWARHKPTEIPIPTATEDDTHYSYTETQATDSAGEKTSFSDNIPSAKNIFSSALSVLNFSISKSAEIFSNLMSKVGTFGSYCFSKMTQSSADLKDEIPTEEEFREESFFGNKSFNIFNAYQAYRNTEPFAFDEKNEEETDNHYRMRF